MRKFLGKLGVIRISLLHATTIFLMIFPTFCHAQTDCAWAQASVGSVSPTTLVAGQTTTVTITGTNLCWWTFDVTVATGSATYIDSDSQNEMVVDITPDASDPAGPATLWIVPSDCNTGTLGCFASIPIPIQIVGGLNITSVTPSGWWAGQKQKITINGSGFLMASDSGGPTALTVSASGVTMTNPVVVSNTQVTTTIDVTKKTPAETVTLTVTNPSTGGTPQTATASPAPVVLPEPVIQWLGKKISGDNANTQKVQVGQPVELTTTPATLPGGYTVSNSSWKIEGTTIKSYSGDDSGITIDDNVDLKDTNTTFYWLYPDNPLNVTYEYCATDPSGNQICTSPQAKATFNTKGADSSNALSTWDSDEATIEHLTDCTTNIKSPYLGYGDLSGPAPDCPGLQNGTPGIKLTASGASGGKYVFAQLIDSDSRTYTSSAGSYTCTTSPNLDKQFPYPPYKDAPNIAPDGPEIPLPSPYLSGERDFVATMYLLWQPPLLKGTSTTSYPVPIGHQQWHFKATTNQKQPIGAGKWEKPTLTNHGDTGGYVPSQATDNEQYGYPVFTAPATEVCPK